MALIIEDGSLIANANSYVTTTEIESFLTSRGILSSNLDTADKIESMALRAMDFLNTQDYSGCRVDNNQALSFPRGNIYLSDNRELASDVIPQELKDAECWLIYYIDQGTDPSGAQTQLVKREKVDSLEIEYQDGGAYSSFGLSNIPNVKQLLKYLITNTSYIDRA